MVVASHNIMRGHFLEDLLPNYSVLRDRRGLSILCLQESQSEEGESHAPQIADTLGPPYRTLCLPEEPGLALLYDGDEFEVLQSTLLTLPQVERLSWLERRYIRGGVPELRRALVVTLKPLHAPPFVLVNVHLDCAGGNGHRFRQMQTIATHLHQSQIGKRLALCGDTNVFSWRAASGPLELEHILSPLKAFEATLSNSEHRPTHFFSRQREPKLSHRLTVALGKIGLDLPRCCDVICTNLGVADQGEIQTPASDHDLVWSQIAL